MKILGVFAAVAILASCVGCGNGQDYSGSNELAKSKQDAAKTPAVAPNGATPTGHPAMAVPSQQHP